MFFIRSKRCILQISSERTGPDFSAVKHQSHQPARIFGVFLQVRDEFSFRFLQCGDISPSLTDPALLSVVGVVDGQVTGFITKEIHLQHFLPLQSSDRHRPGLSPSDRTGPGFPAFKASADRPAQKNATSDVISSQPIACPSYLFTKLVMSCHRPGRSEVRSSELTSSVITVPALQTRPCCR